MSDFRAAPAGLALALFGLTIPACGGDERSQDDICDEGDACAGGAGAPVDGGEGGEGGDGDSAGSGGALGSGGAPEGGAGGSGGGPAATFVYEIDAELMPDPAELDGEALSAVADAEGQTSVFLVDRVWISPAGEAELEEFLDRTAGTVIGDDAVPEPPEDSGIELLAADAEPTQYFVRVDTSDIELGDFEADASAAGLDGAASIGSEEGARLLALVARERANGVVLGPDFVLRSGLVRSSEEHPIEGGYVDAFALSFFGPEGSRSRVTAAWQLVTDRGDFERVRVAIIDGGFWLDSAGEPMSSLDSGDSDLPAGVWQYDFTDGDRVAGGRCMDAGGDCGWHGNQSASVAMGVLDNRYGVAGTGALVADPMLFRMNFVSTQTASAIRTAVAWGADVISMSIGGQCDDLFCGELGGYYPAMRNAWSNNVVMVAAAGNGGDDAIGDPATDQPCRGDHVICVGALDDDRNTAISYSNYGGHVDIWAPTNIWAMPNGDSSGGLVNASGTSAATPFLAGIVAMMRAYDPTLDADQIREILRDTAWTDSTDARVTHSVNAEAAVRAAMGEYSTAPEIGIVRAIGEGLEVDLNRGFNLRADTYDLEDGSPCCTVTWNPEPELTSDSGRNAVFSFDELGPQEISAVATDESGKSAQAVFQVEVVNSPPDATIELPTPGTLAYAGQPTQLSGFAVDPNAGPGPGPGMLPCDRLVWTSDDEDDGDLFPITGCDVDVEFPTGGPRRLLLTATDPEGEVAYDSVYVGVSEAPTNYPPTVSVGDWPEPAELGGEPGYDAEFPIEVSATVSDPEGDTPVTYEWRATSYYPSSGAVTGVFASDVLIGTSLNLDWTPADTPSVLNSNCNLNDAYFGQRVRVTLQATDSQSNTTTRELSEIYVYTCILQ